MTRKAKSGTPEPTQANSGAPSPSPCHSNLGSPYFISRQRVGLRPIDRAVIELHRKGFAEAQARADAAAKELKALQGKRCPEELELVATIQVQNDLCCFHLSSLSSTLPPPPAWWFPNIESVNERLTRHGFGPIQNEAANG